MEFSLILKRLISSPRPGAGSDEFSGTLRNLLGDSAQYFVGLVLMGLANTVLLPLYMRCLAPAEFGTYALIEISLQALIVVAGLGFNTSYLKSYADSNGNDPRGLLGSMTVISAAAALALGIGFALFAASPLGARLLGVTTSRFAYLLAPLALCETLYASYETHLRASRRPTSISAAAVIRLMAIAGFSIWLMVYRQHGLTGLFQGRVLGDLVGMLAVAFFCRRDFTLRVSRDLAREMLQYGIPLVLISLMMLGLDASGRYMLDKYGSLDDVGLYTAGIKISNLMRILFVAPLGAAWGGVMFQIAKKPNATFIYSKLFGYVFALSSAVAAVIALMTPVLFSIFATASYKPAMRVVPWLLLIQVLSILQAPLSTGLFVGHASRMLIPIYAAGLFVDIVACRALIPRFGIYGAAWAWLIAWLAICLWMMWAGQRHYPLHFEWQPVALSICYCTCIAMMGRLGIMRLEPEEILIQVGCGIGAVSVALCFVARDIKKASAGFEIGFAKMNPLSELTADLK